MRRWFNPVAFWLGLLLTWCIVSAIPMPVMPQSIVVGGVAFQLVASAPSGSCPTGVPGQLVNGPGTLYTCQSGTWTNVTGGGGSMAFSGLTSGTNTTAAMHVGTGASLDATGSGTITATAVPSTGITGQLTIGQVGSAGLSATSPLTIASTGAMTVGTVNGTGNLVATTNAALVTPNLGIPSALTLTNALGLPCAAMPVLTGDTTSSAGSCGTTTVNINGTAFAGTSGHLVSFGAANIPADSGLVAANQVNASSPGAGIAHFAGSTQTVTSSAVALGGSDVSGTLPVARGGTNAGTAPNALISLFPTASEVGDLVYCATFAAGACTGWNLLAGNTSGTKVLSETSGGSPSWVSNATTVNGVTCTLGSTCAPVYPTGNDPIWMGDSGAAGVLANSTSYFMSINGTQTVSPLTASTALSQTPGRTVTIDSFNCVSLNAVGASAIVTITVTDLVTPLSPVPTCVISNSGSQTSCTGTGLGGTTNAATDYLVLTAAITGASTVSTHLSCGTSYH